MNTTLEVVIFTGAANLGYSWVTILTLFASLCAFYPTTWEEYHTGTLYLGLVSGLVEGVLRLCAMYAITAFKGGSFWQKPMFKTLGLPCSDFLPPVLRDMPFARWYLVYGGIILAFNIAQSFVTTLPFYHGFRRKAQRRRIKHFKPRVSSMMNKNATL